MEGSFSLRSLVILASIMVIIAFVIVPLKVEARAFFVFGDSLVDNGNNDFLVTTARADSPPYGIDYPTHRPTGRFSNGLNIPDILSERMGLVSPLPYLSPLLKGKKLLHGANFASAGIGILNDTGVQFLNIIRIWTQLEYFEQYQTRLADVIGHDQVNKVVTDGVVLISLGGNDFVNNYYLVPYSARSRQFALPDYVRYVISEYRNVLSRMYDLGARRVLVMGTGPMGCVPAELAQRSRTGECSVELQRAADLYNPQLNDMLRSLNDEKGGQIFVAANTMRMHMDFISNPQAYGTKVPYFSMLWTRSIQWNRIMHTNVKFVPKQRHLCILGSFPSIRKGQ
uniref:GDSL esterase/lipase At5g33370-like isoform X2 n=1 Tax=Erigeron canadensis TaxID=72917 RepID=UPI001CB969F1|nr:GDSL esterase/lipase At5g33370-like isoform X2 [Erigeron canadensis]